jgi:hypothetical protein
MLSLWSADCVEHVVNNFTAVSDEDRRQKAIEIARQWSRGEIKVGVAQKVTVAAHACAREIIRRLRIKQQPSPSPEPPVIPRPQLTLQNTASVEPTTPSRPSRHSGIQSATNVIGN